MAGCSDWILRQNLFQLNILLSYSAYMWIRQWFPKQRGLICSKVSTEKHNGSFFLLTSLYFRYCGLQPIKLPKPLYSFVVEYVINDMGFIRGY